MAKDLIYAMRTKTATDLLQKIKKELELKKDEKEKWLKQKLAENFIRVTARVGNDEIYTLKGKYLKQKEYLDIKPENLIAKSIASKLGGKYDRFNIRKEHVLTKNEFKKKMKLPDKLYFYVVDKNFLGEPKEDKYYTVSYDEFNKCRKKFSHENKSIFKDSNSLFIESGKSNGGKRNFKKEADGTVNIPKDSVKSLNNLIKEKKIVSPDKLFYIIKLKSKSNLEKYGGKSYCDLFATKNEVNKVSSLTVNDCEPFYKPSYLLQYVDSIPHKQAKNLTPEETSAIISICGV